MFSAEFIFEPGDYDDEFHSLNRQIDEAAESTPGFLGRESWQSPDGKRTNAIYYWESLDALESFSRHPKHLEAKRQYTKWYDGFQVVISEVRHSYGDGRIGHITSNRRSSGE